MLEPGPDLDDFVRGWERHQPLPCVMLRRREDGTVVLEPALLSLPVGYMRPRPRIVYDTPRIFQP